MVIVVITTLCSMILIVSWYCIGHSHNVTGFSPHTLPHTHYYDRYWHNTITLLAAIAIVSSDAVIGHYFIDTHTPPFSLDINYGQLLLPPAARHSCWCRFFFFRLPHYRHTIFFISRLLIRWPLILVITLQYCYTLSAMPHIATWYFLSLSFVIELTTSCIDTPL